FLVEALLLVEVGARSVEPEAREGDRHPRPARGVDAALAGELRVVGVGQCDLAGDDRLPETRRRPEAGAHGGDEVAPGIVVVVQDVAVVAQCRDRDGRAPGQLGDRLGLVGERLRGRGSGPRGGEQDHEGGCQQGSTSAASTWTLTSWRTVSTAITRCAFVPCRIRRPGTPASGPRTTSTRCPSRTNGQGSYASSLETRRRTLSICSSGIGAGAPLIETIAATPRQLSTVTRSQAS